MKATLKYYLRLQIIGSISPIGGIGFYNTYSLIHSVLGISETVKDTEIRV